MAHKVPTPPIHNFGIIVYQMRNIEKRKNYFLGIPKNPKNAQVIFNKVVYERHDSLQSKQLSGVKIDALDWRDMPILRKRFKTKSEIKQQQQQTLITSKNLCPF